MSFRSAGATPPPTTTSTSGGGGGGGVRDLGTVTAGMAIMNFDEKTRPYTRDDFIDFLMNYQENLNEREKRLVERGMLATAVGVPAAFAAGYVLSGRLGWHRVVAAMAPLDTPAPQPAHAASASAAAAASSSSSPFSASASQQQQQTPFKPHTNSGAGGAAQAAGGGSKWARRIPRIGRTAFGLAAATIPYIAVQQWFVAAVLAMDDKESALSLHVRRLMLAQRSGMMFTRTATREVTRDEQQRLMREAEAQTAENRSGARREAGLGLGAPDVNLQLGGQVLTPVAQTGYKPLPK